MSVRKLSPNKELRQLILKATHHGWRVEKTNGGHLRWLSPSGFVYHSSSSPSDWRAIRKITQALKREGLRV